MAGSYVQSINKSTNNFENPEVEASVEFRFGPEIDAALAFLTFDLVDVEAGIGIAVNGVLELSHDHTIPDSPDICININAYVYLTIEAVNEDSLLGKVVPAVTVHVWDEDKSVWKKDRLHLEGMPLKWVPNCFCDDDPGGTTPGGGTPGSDWPGTLPAGDLSNLSFESAYKNWTTVGDARAISSLGVLSPTHGNRMAYLVQASVQ